MRDRNGDVEMARERRRLFELLDQLCELEFQIGVSKTNQFRARSRKLEQLLAEKDQRRRGVTA